MLPTAGEKTSRLGQRETTGSRGEFAVGVPQAERLVDTLGRRLGEVATPRVVTQIVGNRAHVTSIRPANQRLSTGTGRLHCEVTSVTQSDQCRAGERSA